MSGVRRMQHVHRPLQRPTARRLTFGPMATTKMACERPASAVEADYLAALSRVTGWAVEPDGRPSTRWRGPAAVRAPLTSPRGRAATIEVDGALPLDRDRARVLRDRRVRCARGVGVQQLPGQGESPIERELRGRCSTCPGRRSWSPRVGLLVVDRARDLGGDHRRPLLAGLAVGRDRRARRRHRRNDAARGQPDASDARRPRDGQGQVGCAAHAGDGR